MNKCNQIQSFLSDHDVLKQYTFPNLSILDVLFIETQSNYTNYTS